MNILKALCIALSTYTNLPLPKLKLEGKPMKYAVIFFPFAGLLVGGAEYLVYLLFKYVDLPVFTMTVLISVVPILLTRGIHLNGYMHSLDALSFGGKQEKRLEIMRDLHVGAYSVIRMFVYVGLFLASVYMLLFYSYDNSLLTYSPDELFGGAAPDNSLNQYTIKQLVTVWCLGFMLARVMSAISTVTFYFKDKSGLAYHFSGRGEDGKINKTALGFLLVELVITIAAMLSVNFMAGGVLIGITALTFVFYRFYSLNKFGGFAGDLAGWFVCLSELFMTLAAAVLAIIA